MGDVVGVYDGTHQTPDYQDQGVMFVSVENIQTLTSDKYISEEDYEKNYSVVPEVGDILMTRIGDIGTANIVKSPEPLAYYVSLALLKNAKLNAEYLKANISAPAFQNELWLRTLHTAYPKKINKEEIGKCMISIAPQKREQEQIGCFFENLDNLITLHQRKHYRPRTCDLSSIFDLFLPHNTATWEQRKLRDVAEFNPRSELPDEFEYVDLESVVGTEMVSHRTEKKNTAPSRAQRLAQSGDVFFQTVRPYQRNNYLFVKPDKNYVFSTGYAQMRPIIDASFLMCFLQTDSFVNVVLDNCTGTSYPAINSNDLSNLSIILPTNQEEQMQIGRMITNLDNLITLHQCKHYQDHSSVFAPKNASDMTSFTATWEQRKLGDKMFIKARIGWQRLTKKEYLDSGEYYLITGTDIDEGSHTVDLSRSYYVSRERYEADANIQMTEGDIIVTKDGTIGKVAILKGLDKPATLNSHLFVLRDLSGTLDTQFLLQVLISPVFQDFVESTKTGSTLTGMPQKTIVEFSFLMPSLQEQKSIASLLGKLDNLITLHQCKHYQGHSSIFAPQNASDMASFTATWEQRKLSSICEKFTDGDWIESKDQSDFGVRLVQTGNVGVAEYLDKPNSRKWISEETFKRLHCEEIFPGDILISRLPEPAGRACIMPSLGTKMITAVDCTIVRSSADVSNKFLVQYLSSQDYFNSVNTCLAGGTRQRVSRSNLAEFDVPIPSNKNEQDKIGELFCNLDNIITLHQRRYF